MHFSKKFFTLAAVSLAALSTPMQAEAFSDAETKELNKAIHAYIMENPTVIINALEKHRADEATRKKQEAADLIKNNKKLLAGKDLPSIGNPKGDVTIVEFFDYNCGYCKRALPDLIKLSEEDKNVRIVFHELPILSDDSRTAALWALAAHKQDKYFDFHKALMQHRGAKNEATLTKLANDVGLDANKMKKDIMSDDVQKMLTESLEIAKKIGISGTPAFIVNDQFFGGYIGHDGLINAIKEARAAK